MLNSCIFFQISDHALSEFALIFHVCLETESREGYLNYFDITNADPQMIYFSGSFRGSFPALSTPIFCDQRTMPQSFVRVVLISLQRVVILKTYAPFFGKIKREFVKFHERRHILQKRFWKLFIRDSQMLRDFDHIISKVTRFYRILKKLLESRRRFLETSFKYL